MRPRSEQDETEHQVKLFDQSKKKNELHTWQSTADFFSRLLPNLALWHQQVKSVPEKEAGTFDRRQAPQLSCLPTSLPQCVPLSGLAGLKMMTKTLGASCSDMKQRDGRSARDYILTGKRAQRTTFYSSKIHQGGVNNVQCPLFAPF